MKFDIFWLFKECISVDVQMRLIDEYGKESSTHGRIEVLYAGIWGSICDVSWTEINNAKVVCRMMGWSE